MTRIIVEIPDETPYDVRVASGALHRLGQDLQAFSPISKVVIITDTEVAPRYLDTVKSSLEQASFKVSAITVPSGEGAKSLDCAGEIWDALASQKLNRNSVVVALGGGVVGDLAGFTGSTFMRGLRIVQVPTTLLSMVDSSVGGKTAINLVAGKNLVGTFCQPMYVCADLETLDTLPEREWACGCGEIAKSAVIDSDDFFFWLTEHAELLVQRDRAVTSEAICRCVAFKANVVVQDKQETLGVRECLNYGHTLAHAIETEAGYGTYSHGHAVAQGMRFAARLAAGLIGTSMDFVYEQDKLLDTLGLPEMNFKADPNRLLEVMLSDKKVRSNKLRFVLPHDVGSWSVEEIEPETVLSYLEAWQRDK